MKFGTFPFNLTTLFTAGTSMNNYQLSLVVDLDIGCMFPITKYVVLGSGILFCKVNEVENHETKNARQDKCKKAINTNSHNNRGETWS